MKFCNKCKIEKELINFHKNKRSGNGYSPVCKVCRKGYDKEYYIENPNYKKQYNLEHKESAKQYRNKHKEHREKIIKQWKIDNPEKAKIIQKRASAKIRSTLKGKLNNSMNGGINRSLHGNKFNQHWELIVGYTANQLKLHLERQFIGGMTWDNYGSYWQIDHIIPISAFNFKSFNDIDFKKCWALKNLRPLEAYKNNSKGAKIDRPFQPSLIFS